MKVFWLDPEGNFPPDGAQFGSCPFLSVKPILHERVTRIKELTEASSPIRIKKKTFFPSRAHWIKMVNKAKKELPKVVLARCCEIECEEKPDPFAITARLLKRAKNSTVFCFADESRAFLGATPEVLFSREGKTIQTEALAGTALAAQSKETFLNSKKDRSEVLPVIEYLKNRLEPLCIETPTFSPLFVKQTPNLLHLCSEGVGKLLPTTTDTQILENIHPTPALCGVPKQKAMDWISKNEPFERGLYGGTLGWFTKTQASWIVAIRCCLIEDKTIKLYTGAGIVPLSDPEKEWDEIENKMKLYDGLFT